MPAALAIPLAIGAGAQVGSAIIGAKAAGKAAKQQQQAVQQAMRYQEPLYQRAQQIAAEQAARGQAAFAPYAQAGTQGLTALTSLLGLPPAPGPVLGQPGFSAPPMPGATVLLRAPNGTQRAVPADQVAHYEARGAR